jgi:DNA (cytosine-5)-methyltransferase 1
MKKITIGSDFSGVGAFDQALLKLGIDYETIFACDMDKYARQTYIHNYGKPKYYPENVYDREIPKESLDIYMTSPPCQAFSLAGKRKGESEKRGILFYNSHEFIQKNKPKFFIFENVKGLLSDDKGKTFQRWIDYLGGKSVNGNPTIFPHDESVPYHVYYQVLNAKNYGVPQNRERIFIIGIRDDKDNNFSFPKPIHLKKRLKDILEDNVDEKFYLSDTLLTWIDKHRAKRDSSNKYPLEENDLSGCITARYAKNGAEDSYVFQEKSEIKQINRNKECLENTIKIDDKENWIKGGLQENQPKQYNGISPCLTSAMGTGGGHIPIHNFDNNKKLNNNQQQKFDSLNVDEEINLEGKVFELRNDEGIREFEGNICGTIRTIDAGGDKYIMQRQAIRRLTPRECFRLMDFPDTFDFSVVSNSQAYKQAGNSIVVNVLCEIIKKIKL